MNLDMIDLLCVHLDSLVQGIIDGFVHRERDRMSSIDILTKMRFLCVIFNV